MFAFLDSLEGFEKDDGVWVGLELGMVDDLYHGLSKSEMFGMLSSLRECGWVEDFSVDDGGHYACRMATIHEVGHTQVRLYAFDNMVAEHEKLQKELAEAPVPDRPIRRRRDPRTSKRLQRANGVLEESRESDRQAANRIDAKKREKISRQPTTVPIDADPFIRGLDGVVDAPTKNKLTLLRSYATMYEKVMEVKPPRLFNGHKPNARASSILNVVRDFGLERTWKICRYVLTNWEELSRVTRQHGKLPTPDVIQRMSVQLDAYFQQDIDPLEALKPATQRAADRASVDEWSDDDDQEGW